MTVTGESGEEEGVKADVKVIVPVTSDDMMVALALYETETETPDLTSEDESGL